MSNAKCGKHKKYAQLENDDMDRFQTLIFHAVFSFQLSCQEICCKKNVSFPQIFITIFMVLKIVYVHMKTSYLYNLDISGRFSYARTRFSGKQRNSLKKRI